MQTRGHSKKHHGQLPRLLLSTELPPHESAPGRQHALPSPGSPITTQRDDGRHGQDRDTQLTPRPPSPATFFSSRTDYCYRWESKDDYRLRSTHTVLGKLTTCSVILPETRYPSGYPLGLWADLEP